MPYIEKDKEYTVSVVSVTDGDTVTVEFNDGEQFDVRVLGIDSPEKLQFQRYERVQEWVGIRDLPYLAEWADRATGFGRRLLGVNGDTTVVTDEQGRPRVTLSFDPVADLFDQFGRLLGYIERGPMLYNRRVIEAGFARAYGSGFSRHDEFAEAERRARREGRGLWAESTPEASSAIRNERVRDVYVPNPVPVTAKDGEPRKRDVAVRSARTAFRPDSDDRDDAAPLVGVDRRANVVLVGGLLISEEYERAEGYDVSTASFGNFPVLTNLLTRVAEKDGDVLIDGGHGQFGADYALSLEDAAYYRRYLEGVGLRFHQYNRIRPANLRDYRAVIVTAPDGAYSEDEMAALREFAESGGVVVLMASGTAPLTPRGRLNGLARTLRTDLRFTGDTLIDPVNNLNGDEQVVTTSWFNGSFDVFRPFPAGD